MLAQILYNPECIHRKVNANRIAEAIKVCLRAMPNLDISLYESKMLTLSDVASNPEMKQGSISCAKTTMSMMVDFIVSGHDYCISLQDDVSLSVCSRLHDFLYEFASVSDPAICQVNRTHPNLEEHDGAILREYGSFYELDHGNWTHDAVVLNRAAAKIMLTSYVDNFRVIDEYLRYPLDGVKYFRSKEPIFMPQGYKSTINIPV